MPLAEDPKRKKMIGEMVNRIVEHFDPEKIILFGSSARGDAGPDSDVDLLVVMPVRCSKRKKQLEVSLPRQEPGASLDTSVNRAWALRPAAASPDRSLEFYAAE